MANNYQQFSAIIPCENEEQHAWLIKALENAADSEEGSVCEYDGSGSVRNVWVYAGEGGDIERLVNIVSLYQEIFNLDTPWVLEWANTCSKMRIDEFSGGAVAVYKGDTHWITPSTIAGEWIAKQKGRPS